MERLGEVFQMEEFKKERIENVSYEEVGVKIENSAFSWGFRVKEDQAKKSGVQTLVEVIEIPTLQNINFELKNNGLLMVIGKIGSGKTTLLYSIMDETRKISGVQTVKGKIAYVE
jgi:ABC-type polysaccharide/polyol phosphate transport system ATPase subunit